MSNVVKHKFISPIPDEGDPTVSGPDEWNQEHLFSGGSNGYYLTWDSGQSDNVRWENPWISIPSLDVTKPPFSAMNTGTSDALSAITSALAVGSILIPAGIYLVSGKISVPSNRSIQLMPGATIIASTGATFGDEGIFTVNAASNVFIGGGGIIDGNKANNPLGRTNGIHITDATNVRVMNLTIMNCPGSTAQGGSSGDGIFVGGATGSADIVIENCVLNHNVRTGIVFTKGINLRAFGNTILDTSGTSPGYGIWVQPGIVTDTLSDIKIIGNYLFSNQSNLFLGPNTNPGPCIVTNNTFQGARVDYNIIIRRHNVRFSENTVTVGNGNGIFINSCTGVRCTENVIQGVGAVAEVAGIIITDASGVAITDNDILTVRSFGIIIDQVNTAFATIFDIIIQGNKIQDCGVNGASGGVIHFQTAGGRGVLYVSLIGNNIFDSRGGSGQQADFGLNTTAMADSDISTWTIGNNLIHGGPTAKSSDSRVKVFSRIHREATLDFTSLTGPNYQDLNIVVPGVFDGDTVMLGVPAAAMTPNTIYQAFSSVPGQITVRCIVTTGTVNPPSALFRVTVETNT